MRKINSRKMLEVLLREFPTHPVPTQDQSMRDFTCEACEDMEMIVGRTWDKIYLDESYIEAHNTFPYWLTATGLKYYMPAVIIYTYLFYEKYHETPGVADVVQFIFEDESGLSVCTEKQMEDLFNLRQLAIVKEWFEFMKEENSF